MTNRFSSPNTTVPEKMYEKHRNKLQTAGTNSTSTKKKYFEEIPNELYLRVSKSKKTG